MSMGPQQIITTTTTTRQPGYSCSRQHQHCPASLAAAGDFFHQVDESFQAAQRNELEKQSGATLAALLRSRSLSTSPKFVNDSLRLIEMCQEDCFHQVDESFRNADPGAKRPTRKTKWRDTGTVPCALRNADPGAKRGRMSCTGIAQEQRQSRSRRTWTGGTYCDVSKWAEA